MVTLQEFNREIERRGILYNGDRFSDEYVQFVDNFLEFAFSTEKKILCPCRDCMNRVRTDNKDILKLHLYKRGFLKTYLVWTFHGEKSPKEEESFDDVHMEDMFRDVVEEFKGKPDVLAAFLGEKDKALYPGCKKEDTVISCLMEVFNMKASSSWSDTSVNKLLKFLHEKLPDGNGIPNNLHDAKRILCPVGMEYIKIHACPNDCILYRGKFKDNIECPVCNAPRYKKKSRGILGLGVRKSRLVPQKCVWYLPIAPRLKRLYRNASDAKHMTWHVDREAPKDDIIRHPADGDQWKNFDALHPKFSKEPRNVRFALCTDGMNPFGNMSSRYSTWPVMLAIYNLPPYLCMKRTYMLMPLLISGPKQPGNDIDTYLAPLIEELQDLWENGVMVYDGYRKEEFCLKGMVTFTINDYPALGNISGYVVKGHKACPICEEDTNYTQLKHGRKTVYLGYRKFLPCKHKLRNDEVNYVGGREKGSAPRPLTGKEIHQKVNKLNVVLGKNKVENSGGTNVGPWKKRSIFFNLDYWEDLEVRHCLDVMHIEKNVCESLIGTLLNIPGKSKDSLNARKDLVELGIRTDLAPEVKGKRTYLPPAQYSLFAVERRSVCESIKGTKVPSGYSSNLSNLVNDDLKITGLKSHDCHVLMQQILPVALRGVLEDDVRNCVTRLCFFFHSICRKEISREQLKELEFEAVVVLCLLEKYFPPAFFDIMVHLVVHLSMEIRLCGHVGFHWMYPFERHMGTFKGYVKCRSRPDASIVQRYVTEEIIEYCTTYLAEANPIGVPKNQHTERRIGVPRSKGKNFTPFHRELMKVHLYVLRNSKETAGYVDENIKLISTKYPAWSPNMVLEEHSKLFVNWFYSRCNVDGMSENLRAFARKPNCTVRTYTCYDINGWSFSTAMKDMKSTTGRNP